MSEVVRIILIIAIVAVVIGRQLIGEPMRGKRVVVLPIVLTVIGFSDLGSSSHPVRPADVACLVGGGIAVALIGVAQAASMRMETRNGFLWGQMPVKALWLWALLIAARVVTTVVADGVDAKVAASSSTILLMLGINRLAQAAVVLPRAMTAGVDFAPEKDGKSRLTGLTGGRNRSSSTQSPYPGTPQPYGPPAQAYEPPVQHPYGQQPYGPTADQQPNEARPSSGSSIDWSSVASQVGTFLENRRRDR
jgi:hypothetical protein